MCQQQRAHAASASASAVRARQQQQQRRQQQASMQAITGQAQTHTHTHTHTTADNGLDIVLTKIRVFSHHGLGWSWNLSGCKQQLSLWEASHFDHNGLLQGCPCGSLHTGTPEHCEHLNTRARESKHSSTECSSPVPTMATCLISHTIRSQSCFSDECVEQATPVSCKFWGQQGATIATLS